VTEEIYEEFVRLMTDRSLTPPERRKGLDEFKATHKHAVLDRCRLRFFEGK
jgi:hypothetical protein